MKDPKWWQEFQEEMNGLLSAYIRTFLPHYAGAKTDIFRAISRLASNIIAERFGGQPRIGTLNAGGKELELLETLANAAAALADLYKQKGGDTHA